MDFRESVAYLYSLGNEVLAMKLGLASTEKLLAALGNPQNNYLKVQVAGTNGKGSTCAFLEAVCLRAGIKVGLTTSPHLISVTERIKINGREISEKDFARHAALIRETAEKLVANGALETVPTYFEQVTAIALNAFAEAKIELAILETGLGGRFDATTAARAEIVAFTPIDYDHQKILGETLEKIAAEKAAIIRSDTRVHVAPQKSEAERIIKARCRACGVEPRWATTDVKIKKHDEAANDPLRSVSFKTARGNYPNVVPGLAGSHQTTNAALALAVAETLRDDFRFKITDGDIRLGLETARHKGRLEFYRGILFDGAHNAAGARALVEYLAEFARRPVTLVFGAMRDKDLTEIAATLFPRAEFLIFTAPDNPRSMKAGELIKFAPENFARDKIFQTPTVAEALKTARAVSPKENLICVTGSLYLVGEAQKILGASVLPE